MRLITSAAALILLVLALGIAACGGDDDNAGAGTATATKVVTATADTGGNGGGGATFVEIDAADFSFSPTEVTTEADIELTFAISNTGDSPHTFNLYRDADYTQTVEAGKTGQMPSKTVGEFIVTLGAGEYFFRCELHPGQMQGTLTAE